MKNPGRAAWPDSGHRYYSQIGPGSTQPVTIFSAPDEEVSHQRPGTPCVHLEPGFRLVRVLDSDRKERGVIRAEGFMPLSRHVMRAGSEVLWVLSVRSVVRAHHTLRPAAGDQWMFDTPFFWWQQLSGSVSGTPKLFGRVGPTKRLWFMMIEAGYDTPDVLAAVACMHREWWRW